MRLHLSFVLIAAALLAPFGHAAQKIGVVQSHVKLSDTFGSFGGDLPEGARFGEALAVLADLDGDGVDDLAVGAPGEDAIYILFMTAEGAVTSERRLGLDEVDAITGGDDFGASLAYLGDIDGDDVPELAVGEPFTITGGTLHVLSLDVDGSVLAARVVTSDDGFPTVLESDDQFATSVAVLGDLNGDLRPELAVGAPGDDDGLGNNTGAVWVLFLDEDGLVAQVTKISDTAGNFSAQLEATDRFGTSVAGLGDVDGDGVPDLAVGAIQDDDPITDSDQDDLGIDFEVDSGAVWILFLAETGEVITQQKISNRKGGFSGCSTNDVIDEVGGFFDEGELLSAIDQVCTLDTGDRFGSSLAGLGDIDGDGVPDLAVGARTDDDGNGANSGAIWILQLDDQGHVRIKRKISDQKGKFSGTLDPSDRFGWSLAAFIGEDGPTATLGSLPLAVGAPFDDDGGSTKDDADEDRGAVWLLRVKVFAGLESFDGELSLGDKVEGGITSGGEHRFEFEAAAGASVSVFAKRRRNPVEPQLSLSLGESVLVEPPESVVSPKLSRIKAFVIEETGTYSLALANPSLAGGDYRLVTKAKQPTKLVAAIVVPEGETADAYEFEALAGWTLKALVVKSSNKACEGVDAGDLLPEVVALRGPDASSLDLEGHVTITKKGVLVLKDVALPLSGTYSLELAGSDGTSGCAKLKGKLQVPKGSKLFVPDA